MTDNDYSKYMAIGDKIIDDWHDIDNRSVCFALISILLDSYCERFNQNYGRTLKTIREDHYKEELSFIEV